LSDLTVPEATKRNELPRLSITPQPVFLSPGSIPIIRIASAMKKPYPDALDHSIKM
jgi:hypothetical protein